MRLFLVYFSWILLTSFLIANDENSKQMEHESTVEDQQKAEEKKNPNDGRVLEANQEILEKIKNLKANEACFLPAPIVIQELGNFWAGHQRMKRYGPGGRDYSIKMIWMPDRARAFFCGANHGVPHRLNDAWEYDLASNTWVLLYNPDYDDTGKVTDYTKETLVVEDGFLRTKKGGPGHPAHTWWQITYDANIKKIIWFCAWPDYRLNAKLSAIGATREDLFKGPPIWTFDPAERKWDTMKTTSPWPETNIMAASLEYVPDLKKTVLQYKRVSAILDPEAKTWKLSNAQGGGFLKIETVTYYDTKRKLFVAHRGDQPKKDADPSTAQNINTWIAKLEGESITPWELVSSTLEAPRGHDASSVMYYDPKSGDGLCFDHRNRSIWRFNPDEKNWKKLNPSGEQIGTDKEGRITSYFDIARNVYVVIGDGWVWCYRYQ